MREKKFKAWDRHKKRWCTWKEATAIVQNDAQMRLGIIQLYDGPESFFDFVEYTGLKDKNGKEIYEKSIVKFQISEDFTGPRSSIKEVGKEYIGSFEWDETDANFYIMNTDDKWPYIQMYFARDIEIIGTVYENPELLK